MNLQKAMEILKIEKGVCDLDISNNEANNNQINFSNAISYILLYLKMIQQIEKEETK